MSTTPLGMVPCKAPEGSNVCRGVKNHLPGTNAACGATKATINGAAAIRQTPPSARFNIGNEKGFMVVDGQILSIDPQCPQHTRERLEVDAAALTWDEAKQYAAKGTAVGAMGVFAAMGLCSCTPVDNTPVPSDTPTVEQTVEATPTADVPDVIVPSSDFDLDGFSVSGSEESDWAAYSDGYVFSDEPQSVGEAYIYENYPELWEQGIRVVSGQYISGYDYDDPSTLAGLVQYIDGVRYEGTQETPLGFRGQTDDPDSIATDAYEAMIRNMGNSSLTQADVGNTGQGGYAVQIANDFQDHTDYTLTVVERQKNAADKVVMSESYRSWEDAFAALEASGFSPMVGDRDLYPGEISVIERYEVDRDSSGKTISTAYVYNPETGQWVVAAEAG